MNTDIDFNKIVEQKQAEPDKPPSADVLSIRWTCENILEEVCLSKRSTDLISVSQLEEDMIESFQKMESDEDFDDEDLIEELCLDSGICTSAHHDELQTNFLSKTFPFYGLQRVNRKFKTFVYAFHRIKCNSPYLLAACV